MSSSLQAQEDADFARFLREPLPNLSADRAAWKQYLTRSKTTHVPWKDQIDFLEQLHDHETSLHKIFPTSLSLALQMRAKVQANLQHMDWLIQSMLSDIHNTPPVASAAPLSRHRSMSQNRSSKKHKPQDKHTRNNNNK